MLGIAVSYALCKRLFGDTAALVGAGLGHPMVAPVFQQAWGTRDLSADHVRSRGFVLLAWRSCTNWKHSIRDYVLAGIFAGLSLHTYMAARAVPLIFALFFVYLGLFHGPLLRDVGAVY